MTESEYWDRLRFRLNSLPILSPHPSGWCDWFAPKRYVLGGPSPRIIGRVGFVNGRHASEWEFTLYLRRAVDSWSEIDWAALLPAEGSTGWLRCESNRGRIEIDPFAGLEAPNQLLQQTGGT